jgi:CDP-6-deoxy-D-xylo-4-hexulose-3-dehydrase
MNKDLSEILDSVKRYAESNLVNKTWEAGKDYVNYAGPFFDHNEYVSAVNTILNGWLVMGNDSLKFEHKFPKFFGKDYGILTNSGSSSNLLMMYSLTSKNGYFFTKGTKVLMPIGGFPTTLNPTLQVGFEPVFLDIELDTLNLDLTKAEDLIKEHNIKIITFAHVLGNPPNMNQVMDLVKKYDMILLEDCCDALGSTYDNKPLGSFGEMASCSFYPAHHITMGEGGFIASKTKEQEVILRSLREWGRGCFCVGPKANTLKCGTCKNRFSNWIPSLPDETFDHKYVYDEIGFNMKPIEMQASIGLRQIEKLDVIGELRRRNYKLLFDIYSKYEEFFYLPRATENSDPSWFAFPLTIRNTAPFTRFKFLNYLEDKKIQTRPYFAGNIMLQPAYSHIMASHFAKVNYPNATFTTTNTFFHGTSPVISTEQINYIELVVNDFMKRFI